MAARKASKFEKPPKAQATLTTPVFFAPQEAAVQIQADQQKGNDSNKDSQTPSVSISMEYTSQLKEDIAKLPSKEDFDSLKKLITTEMVKMRKDITNLGLDLEFGGSRQNQR